MRQVLASVIRWVTLSVAACILAAALGPPRVLADSIPERPEGRPPVASEQAQSPFRTVEVNGAWKSFPGLHALQRHASVYDPIRDRMLIIGGLKQAEGEPTNDVWSLSLSDTLTWTRLEPVGFPPPPITDHAAVFDSVRNRVIVIMGNAAGYTTSSVWALNLDDPPVWSQLDPVGPLPPPREDHSAIYDPVRDRVVIFGGRDDHGMLKNDVWALSLTGEPRWTLLIPALGSPLPRFEHAAVYDP